MISPERLHVLLVDDHAMVRESIAHLLREDAGFEVRHCGNIADAIRILQTNRPDLMLLDYDLGDESATDLLAQLDQTGFVGPTVILTARVNNLTARRLVRMGVAGILLKSNSMSILGSRLRDIRSGHTCFDIDPGADGNDDANGSSKNGLTPREKLTLHEIVSGLSNKEIAIKHDLSESSVKATTQRLFGKTGARTRSQLVRIALEKGFDSI